MVGELIADRYELEELCGSGGMSSVFRAHDRILDRDVALKILHERFASDSDYVERFRHEAEAVAKLTHANVVTVIDRGEQGGRQFIVFEYVDGENVKQLIVRRGPLPVREALEIGVQAASGLAFAHKQGLVHRDVKPQNILVNADGRARVTDFGIARRIDVEIGLTQTGSVVGTSSYIAPEQARGERVDALSDVYSLGAVLYELLTGEVPFDGENFVAVAMKHIHEPAPSVVARRPDVPMRVDAAVQRAMAKLPGDRFPSMDDFARELRACIADLGSESFEATLVTRGDPVLQESHRRMGRSRRRGFWLLVALGAAAAVAAVVGAALLLRSGDSTANPPTTGTTVGGETTTPVRPVRLTAISAYDPSPGDGSEHDNEIAEATDGDNNTSWETESYRYADGGFGPPGGKAGVGLLLDARKRARVSKIQVITDAPGYTAEIQAGDSPEGPFEPVSSSQTVNEATTFDLRRGTDARYYVLWITRRADGEERAAVNEVSAR